jgi:hypothetical protein
MQRKKIWAKVLMTLLAVLTSVGAWADSSGSCGSGVTWSYDDGTKTLTISGTGAMDNYYKNGHAVNTPWNDYRGKITTVVIEDGVTNIGDAAFYTYYTALASVTIPNSVTSIGDYAFYECDALQNITIPANVTIIGEKAFYDCSNLENVIFEDNSQLTTIGEEAFRCCSKLASFTVPNSVTTIGGWAFWVCSNLTSFTIGSGVSSIGDGAIGYCEKLENITVATANEHFKVVDNVLFSKDGKTLVAYPMGKTATEYTIPASVTTIGFDAFYHCPYLETVTIENNSQLTTISDYAFCNCENLESFNIPASVTSIGYEAFYECEKLQTVTIADGSQLTTIGDEAFCYCKNLETINIPASVTSIGSYVFYDTKWLDNQPNEAYEDGVLYINNMAVASKGVSGKVTIKPGTTAISGGAFDECSTLTSIVIPASVTNIGEYAFYDCVNLLTVTIADGSQLTTIGEGAFDYCENLQSINIPNSVTSIGEEAFYKCEKLPSINIPHGVTSIGEEAFYCCDALQNITIPASVTTISYGAFYGCCHLQTVTIADGSQLTTIGEGAFEYCENLQSINIPNSVTSIGDYTFYECYALQNITIPASVTTIGGGAFWDCNKLKTVTIADGSQLTAIGDYAFYRCDLLETFTIPANVTSIGRDAFRYCSYITDVYCYANPATLTWDDGNCNDFKAGKGTVCHVENAADWSDFENKVNLTFAGGYCGNPGVNDGKNLRYEVVGDVLTISKNPNAVGTDFSMADGCNFGAGIKNIVIQDGVTSIGANAFAGFTTLTSVTIPASVTSIGANAFNGCSTLAEVLVLPATPPTLGDNAFAGIVNNAVFTVRNAEYQSASGWTEVNGNSGDYEGCNFTMTPMDVTCVNIAYIDADGQAAVCPVATPITNSDASVTFSFSGDVWYVVKKVNEGVTINGELKFNSNAGSTNIILCDGATLTVGSISASNNLNIFVQSNGDDTGAITANSTVDEDKAISVKKDLTINGGKITATATGNNSNGVNSSEGNITINGGTIVVNSDNEGICSSKGNITINGGDITVTTDNNYGINACDGELTINGGKITTTNTNYCGLYGDYTTINDGTLLVSAIDYGIYGYYNLDINGGTITVNGAENGLYAERYGTVNGGTVNTNDTKYGFYVDDYDINILGGNITVENAQYGLYAYDGNLTIINANVTVAVSADNGNCYGIFSDEILTIIDSNINVTANSTSTNDSDSSNGIYPSYHFTLSGSNVTVNATAGNGNSYGIHTEYTLNINGGKVVANGDIAGISVNNNRTFTLGWTNFGDYVYASSYELGPDAKMVIAGGQTFTYDDGTVSLEDDITDQADVIAGKYLLPIVDNINMKANAHDGNFWTTFYSGVSSYSVGAGVTIYTAKVSDDQTKLVLTKVEGNVVKKGEAVLLKSESANITISSANPEAEMGDFTGNELQGVDVRTACDDILADGTFYVMSKIGDDFGFFEYIGDYMPAHKAFIALASSASAPLRGLSFVEEETTGIAALNDNGEMINDNDSWYTLSGVKLEGKPTEKGVYIHNGKKYIVQ